MIPFESLEDGKEGGMICFSIWVDLLYMQEERSCEEERTLSLVRPSNSEEGVSNVGCVYKRGNSGPHWPLELQGFKTPVCGSWMKSTKNRKTIVEKSCFQKV